MRAAQRRATQSLDGRPGASQCLFANMFDEFDIERTARTPHPCMGSGPLSVLGLQDPCSYLEKLRLFMHLLLL